MKNSGSLTTKIQNYSLPILIGSTKPQYSHLGLKFCDRMVNMPSVITIASDQSYIQHCKLHLLLTEVETCIKQ